MAQRHSALSALPADVLRVVLPYLCAPALPALAVALPREVRSSVRDAFDELATREREEGGVGLSA